MRDLPVQGIQLFHFSRRIAADCLGFAHGVIVFDVGLDAFLAEVDNLLADPVDLRAETNKRFSDLAEAVIYPPADGNNGL